MKNQARNEIFRQMTMTLTLIQNVIYVQWTVIFFILIILIHEYFCTSPISSIPIIYES